MIGTCYGEELALIYQSLPEPCTTLILNTLVLSILSSVGKVSLPCVRLNSQMMLVRDKHSASSGDEHVPVLCRSMQ